MRSVQLIVQMEGHKVLEGVWLAIGHGETVMIHLKSTTCAFMIPKSNS